MIESGQRGITLAQASKYCGITEQTYRSWIESGLVPGFWPGTRRIDKIKLDEALDAISQQDDKPQQELSAYAAWKEVAKGRVEAHQDGHEKLEKR